MTTYKAIFPGLIFQFRGRSKLSVSRWKNSRRWLWKKTHEVYRTEQCATVVSKASRRIHHEFQIPTAAQWIQHTDMVL